MKDGVSQTAIEAMSLEIRISIPRVRVVGEFRTIGALSVDTNNEAWL